MTHEKDIKNLLNDFNKLIHKYLYEISSQDLCSILIARITKITYSIAPSHKEAMEWMKESTNEGIKLFLKEDKGEEE